MNGYSGDMSQEPAEQSAEPSEKKHHAKAVKAAAANLGQFVSAHGGPATVHVEHISANRTRVVVVGEDGRWGDQVLPSYDAAKQVISDCGFEAEPEGEWSREAVGSVKTTGFEWGRMGSGRAAGR